MPAVERLLVELDLLEHLAAHREKRAVERLHARNGHAADLVCGHHEAAGLVDLRTDLAVQMRPSGVDPVAADQARRPCNADEVMVREVSEQFRREIRRHDLDVVVREHQDLPGRAPDAAVIAFAQRARVVYSDDFVRHVAQERAIVRANLFEALGSYAADDHGHAAPVARVARKQARHSAVHGACARAGDRPARLGVQHHRIFRAQREACGKRGVGGGPSRPARAARCRAGNAAPPDPARARLHVRRTAMHRHTARRETPRCPAGTARRPARRDRSPWPMLA